MAGHIERTLIKSAYPNSKAWGSRVDKMPDSQVVAIMLRLRKEGKIP